LASETNYNFCFRGIEARGEPTFGYYQGSEYSGQGSIELGGTTEVTFETLSSQESTPYCMEGTLGATSGDFARLRFASNQMPGGPEGVAPPQGDGLDVMYDLNLGEDARLVLSSSAGEFCAELTNPFGQQVPWLDFSSCDGLGTPYGGEPFSALSIEVVPGGSSEFSTCFFDVRAYEEGGGPGGMGGAGVGGGSSGGGLPPPAGRTDLNRGYLDDGVWTGLGYSFASASSTVTSDVEDWDGPQACASGAVGAPFPDYAAVGYAVSDEAPAPATGEGVWVELRESYGREHRLNVVNSGTGEYWCATLGFGSTPGPQFVPWTSLNSACWNGSGETFDPSTDEISHVEIQVPSTGFDEPFEFCIDRLQSGLISDF
jgi:hypothetical protein